MAETILSEEQRDRWRSAVGLLRAGPLAGLWLFAWVFLAQFGHVIEHIAKAITGAGLLGPSFDSEFSHLLFNGAIGMLAVLLVLAYPRNPWVYPLAAISVLHGIEHAYIYAQFVGTGATGGPGLLGRGGVVGTFPLERLDLHNAYNGVELILLTLGVNYQFDSTALETRG